MSFAFRPFPARTPGPARPAPLLRPARPGEARALAAILCDWAEATPWMPRRHSRAEAAAHLAPMIAAGQVTVADAAARPGLPLPPLSLPRLSLAPLSLPRRPRPAGFLARRGSFIHALYLTPAARRQGIGRALLAEAKAATPRLTLWVFAANIDARAFYAAQGFVAVEAGDGRGNDEGLPELRLEWQRNRAGAEVGMAAHADAAARSRAMPATETTGAERAARPGSEVGAAPGRGMTAQTGDEAGARTGAIAHSGAAGIRGEPGAEIAEAELAAGAGSEAGTPSGRGTAAQAGGKAGSSPAPAPEYRPERPPAAAPAPGSACRPRPAATCPPGHSSRRRRKHPAEGAWP